MEQNQKLQKLRHTGHAEYSELQDMTQKCSDREIGGTYPAVCFNGEKRSIGLKVLKVKSFSRTATGVCFRT